MLREAALQLDLLLAGLDEDLILKDSSPYNVQTRGATPGCAARSTGSQFRKLFLSGGAR